MSLKRITLGKRYSPVNYCNNTAKSPLCRMCGSGGVAHVVSECSKLTQTKYKGRHDDVAQYIHWQPCGKCGLERASNWYEQKPEGVVERVLEMALFCNIFFQVSLPDSSAFCPKNHIISIAGGTAAPFTRPPPPSHPLPVLQLVRL